MGSDMAALRPRPGPGSRAQPGSAGPVSAIATLRPFTAGPEDTMYDMGDGRPSQ